MKGYVLVDVEVFDDARYAEYRAKAGPTVVQHGGRYLVRGGAHDTLEGDWEPHRVVVLEFPSVAAARTWYNSPEYQAAAPLRRRASTGSLVLVEGAPAVPLPP